MSTKKKNTDPANAPVPELPQVPENPEQTNPETPPVDPVPEAPENPENTTNPAPEKPKDFETEYFNDPEPENNDKGKGRKAKKSYPDYLQAYVDKYPKNKTFHVTSDRMVFLAADKNLAVLHQGSIKGSGTVETYNI